MKNIVVKILIFIIAMISIILTLNISKKEYVVNNSEKPILQIPIISDTHVSGYWQNRKVIKVLKSYKKLAPEYDAIAFVGDITHWGYVSHYEKLMKIINKYTYGEAEKIITMGNHEYFEGAFNTKSGLSEQNLKDRFVEKTGMPGVYYDKWVKGYHFIILGGEESKITKESNDNNAVISDKQYEWLENTLPVNAENNKPIFVFLHQPIDNTVYGSQNWGAGLDDKLKKILSKYPQVIFFSGHSHYPLSNPNSVYQDGFTMVNTGSLFTTCDNVKGEEVLVGHLLQGLLVNVYDDRVDIKARQFSDNTWIKTTTIYFNKEKSVE